jgi:Autographiviridae endonuclease VII
MSVFLIFMKTCIKCRIVKEPSDFYIKANQCKKCVAEYQRGKRVEINLRRQARRKERFLEAPHIVRNQQRLWKYRIRYNIDLEAYGKMKTHYNGLCAICLKEPEEPLHVDHCHSTGEVRGLLCRKCNMAIGFLKDNPESCWRAGDYLAFNNFASGSLQ